MRENEAIRGEHLCDISLGSIGYIEVLTATSQYGKNYLSRWSRIAWHYSVQVQGCMELILACCRYMMDLSIVVQLTNRRMPTLMASAWAKTTTVMNIHIIVKGTKNFLA